MRARALVFLALAACGGDGVDVSKLPDGGHPPTEPTIPAGSPTADALRARLHDCGTPVGGMYATDIEAEPTVSICTTGTGSFFWTADLDVDCDGKTSKTCNASTDDAYQNETSATDSNDEPLDATVLPYVVIPLPSASRFDFPAQGVALGDVVGVVYGDKVRYGVYGDEGPEEIIGESSHAMAESLGIDPDPNTGGTDGPVLYFVFPGSGFGPIEDHAATTTKGAELATHLVATSAPNL